MMDLKASMATMLMVAVSCNPAPAQTAKSTPDLTQSRAVEAVIWGMPAVNYDLMLQAALKAGAKENEIVYWGKPSDWRNQTLTPNPDSIYLMTFYNTKDVGPIVIDVPPAGDDGSLTANIDDLWQMPLEDAGPSGADQGKGGKYLILPPRHTGAIPDGYIVLRPATYAGFALLRSTLRSHAQPDVDKAVAYGKRIQVYPLSAAPAPPATRFTDVKDVIFDSTIRYDASFFKSLDRIVQSQPWIERDRAMIDQLRTLGIAKGQHFAPDARMTARLDAAAKQARAWLDSRYDASFVPFANGSRWSLPVPRKFVEEMQSGYTDPDAYFVDTRGVTYTFGFVGIKRLGTGQSYLLTIKDKSGKPLEGRSNYRLRVPPNVPVAQYWSVTAYDRATHALIKGMARASRASNASDVQKNPDGSVDVYFGPKPPTGKQSNWVPTDAKRGFELMFRVYGPQKDFFNKVWVLPDVERVSG